MLLHIIITNIYYKILFAIDILLYYNIYSPRGDGKEIYMMPAFHELFTLAKFFVNDIRGVECGEWTLYFNCDSYETCTELDVIFVGPITDHFVFWSNRENYDIISTCSDYDDFIDRLEVISA